MGEETLEEFTKKRPPAARKAARHDDDPEELGRGVQYLREGEGTVKHKWKT